jgi:hypothetical protein
VPTIEDKWASDKSKMKKVFALGAQQKQRPGLPDGLFSKSKSQFG